MIAVRPFDPADLGAMRIQPQQRCDLDRVGDAAAFALAAYQGGPAFTAISDGRPLAACGIIEINAWHGTAWAVLAEAKGPHFVAITRAVRAVLEASGYARIDTPVRSDFEEGHVWARLLGFEREGRMRAWGHDGADWDLYARKGGMA